MILKNEMFSKHIIVAAQRMDRQTVDLIEARLGEEHLGKHPGALDGHSSAERRLNFRGRIITLLRCLIACPANLNHLMFQLINHLKINEGGKTRLGH
jgi:hypothetical protein